LAQTQQQIHRLENVFEMHGSQAKAVDCPAIDGIIKEAKEIMGDVKLEDKVLDAAWSRICFRAGLDCPFAPNRRLSCPIAEVP
jgi:ferritin-like metal-binding protein YciE